MHCHNESVEYRAVLYARHVLNKSLLTFIALSSTYLIWGTTYLAIHFAVQSLPPFLMAGFRFVVAGFILYGVLRWLGFARPTTIQWQAAAVVGLLLPALGNGTVCYVQQTVNSSIAALAIATAPIWIAIFSVGFGHRMHAREWLGIAIGVVGIGLLKAGDTLHGDWWSTVLLLMAAAFWAFGSVWQKQLNLPAGLMGSACQMITGGLILLIASVFAGESWPKNVSQSAWLAVAYLIVFASIISYSAYLWLLQHVRPLVASSNTFVNPIVAFFVGVTYAGDSISALEYWALVVILVGVVMILTARQTKNDKS